MRAAREVIVGFLLGALSMGIVLGGIALSLAESNLIPMPTMLATQTPTLPPATNIPATPTSVSVTETPTAILISTSTPSPTLCPPAPQGWVQVQAKTGDTVYSVASRYGITAETLTLVNCLGNVTELQAGMLIFVPFVPTIVPTPCRPPADWGIYIVQKGDTLYRIGQLYRVSVQELQRANCMGSSQLIITGQRLYVPKVPTSTPQLGPTATLTATATATTPTVVAPSNTPTATNTPEPSNTPEPPSNTPESIPTTATP